MPPVPARRLYRLGFTTDLSEMDIVMGNGEKRLYRAIKEAIARHAPPAVFVYATCVPALIGDDIEAVCRHAHRETRHALIPVNAPGFAGSKNLGNKLAGEALLDHVIGTREPDDVTPTDINILGEYNLSRRALAGQAAAGPAGHPHSCLHHRRRALQRHRRLPPRPAST